MLLKKPLHNRAARVVRNYFNSLQITCTCIDCPFIEVQEAILGLVFPVADWLEWTSARVLELGSTAFGLVLHTLEVVLGACTSWK